MMRQLMKSDLTVQVEVGGVRRAVRGVLDRSARRSDLSRWRKVRGHLLEGGRSLVAFVLGLLLASLYGLMALFLQKQSLWSCVHVTRALAALAAFSLGLTAGARADAAVLLPSLCSAQGRKFLLFLFMSVLVTGPLTNTLENTERAAASLLCGAELAANQTQELMQGAATPLFSALDRIREISSNAHAVAGRVQDLILALTDSVRHVARTLRNVLHFLADIGDVCNAKLGAPYRKCVAVFAEARADCSEVLGEFDFLCDIVDDFLPLCSLARAGELFCIIPSYIAEHLRKRLAAPTVAAFERMKREFDFNISASVTFDLGANSSRSLQQVSQDIMEEVSSELQLLQKLSEPLVYAGLVLLAVSFLRAARYRRRFLRELDFDNIYISAQFKELDQQLSSGGGASVLPITRREARTYISPLSCQLTGRERRALLGGVASVLRCAVLGVLLVALDLLVFWMLDQVQQQVRGDVVARAPMTAALRVNGSGYASDIFRDLAASLDVLQRGNVTVISRKCLLQPSPPDYTTCFTLGLLLGLSLLTSITTATSQRCRRLTCTLLHPEREQERIRFLRQQILDQRREEGRALRRSAGGAGGGAGGSGSGGSGGSGGRLEAVLLRLPGGLHLSHLLGLSSARCVSCEETVRRGDGVEACGVPQCPAVCCRSCFHSLGNTCVVCGRPLTSDGGEDELDSSDDEAGTRRAERSDDSVRTIKDEAGSDSEADVTDRPESEDSDASFCSVSVLQDQDACTHRPALPETSRTLQDPPGPSRTLQDSPGLSRTLRDSPGPSRTLQDSPGPSRTLQDPPGPSRTLKGFRL